MTFPNPERPAIEIAGIKFYYADRLYEWFAAGVMLCMAFLLSFPNLRMTGAFAQLQAQGISQSALCLFFSVFGTLRCFALVANGNINVLGPRVRAACALVAGPVWAILFYALFIDAIANGRLSLGLAIYFMLMVAEIIAASRATGDVGRI